MHITNHKNMSCFDEKQLFFRNTESDFFYLYLTILISLERKFFRLSTVAD